MSSRSMMLVSCSLVLGGCVLPTMLRRDPGARAATHHSPADGLVVLPVRSSTGAVAIDVLQVQLREADLRFRVSYETKDQTFLIEPGRYEVEQVWIGKYRAWVSTPAFVVRSGRITVLPTLRVFEEDDVLFARFETGTSTGPEDFGAKFETGPWSGKPWTVCAWPHAGIAAVLSVTPPPTWSMSSSSGSSHTHRGHDPGSSSRSPSISPRTPR